MRSLDFPLVLFLDDGAIAGRVRRFTPTGLEALLEREAPRDTRFAFHLHLNNGIVAGEAHSLGLREELQLLQFASLTTADRAKLAPWLQAAEAEES